MNSDPHSPVDLSDEAKWKAFAKECIRQGDQSLPTLVVFLESESAVVQERAIEIINAIGWQYAALELSLSPQSAQPVVRPLVSLLSKTNMLGWRAARALMLMALPADYYQKECRFDIQHNNSSNNRCPITGYSTASCIGCESARARSRA